MIAALFCLAGLLHFIKPGFYLQIMPDYIPWHRALVWISGAAEVLGGLGILLDSTRTPATWGLILLLLAVFPANIDMFIKAMHKQGWTLYTWLLLARLPLQFVLMYWVYWAGTNT